VASGVMSRSVEGINDSRIDVSCRPATEGRPGIFEKTGPVDLDAQKPGKGMPWCAAEPAEGREILVDGATCDSPGAGTGGSAMPWGLVLPAASAKLVKGNGGRVVG